MPSLSFFGFSLAAALFLPTLARAASMHLGDPTSCQHMRVEADEGVCDKQHCVFTGGVSLGCESMRLWANQAEVKLTPTGEFGGAIATGDVVWAEKDKLLTCQSVSVGPDQVKTRIEDAIVYLRKGPLSPEGIPQGRNIATFSGTLERQSANQLHIDDAHLTLCDCSPSPIPTWELRASSVDAVVDERAAVRWPVVWINLLGTGLQVPITPPVPYWSLPLKPRAAGLLPPSLTFYRFPVPTIDLPFFIPLGESADITLAPGIRTDWADNPTPQDPDRWGGWRLGSRFRYAPTNDSMGTLQAQYTYDGNQGSARFQEVQDALRACRKEDTSTDECELPPPYAKRIANWDLKHRVGISLKHQTLFSAADNDARVGSGLLEGLWHSDDAYATDFQRDTAESRVGYLPSRAQLLLGNALGSLSVSADYIQRIVRGGRLSSNLSFHERLTPVRGPALSLATLPVQIAGPLIAQAQTSFVRYGAITTAKEPALLLTQTQVDLSAAGTLGPLRNNAGAAIDSLWLQIPSGSHSVPIVTTHADVAWPLGRAFGGLAHTLTPGLSYRGIARHDGPNIDVLRNTASPIARQIPAIDSALRRDGTTHQVALKLSQSLYTFGPLSENVQLVLSQPYDIPNERVLPTWAEVSVDTKPFGSRWWVSVSTEKDATREVGGSWRVTLGPVGLNGGYLRWSPRSSRLLRGPYELEAPEDPTIAPLAYNWLHTTRGGASVKVGESLLLAYSAFYNLEIPERRDQKTPTGKDVPVPPQGFTQHRGRLRYDSPCDCFGFQVDVIYDPLLETTSIRKRVNAGVVFNFGKAEF